MRALEHLKQMTAVDIARIAGIRHQPQSPTSHAATELGRWRDAICEAWEDGRLFPGQDDDDWADITDKITDETVTGDDERQWEVFTELRLWGELGSDDVLGHLTMPYRERDGWVVVKTVTFTKDLAGAVLEVIARRVGGELAAMLHTGSNDIDTIITNLYSNADNDGDHSALETILIRAGYQWRCHTTKTAGDRECGWVNRASDSECGACGSARGEHTRP